MKTWFLAKFKGKNSGGVLLPVWWSKYLRLTFPQITTKKLQNTYMHACTHTYIHTCLPEILRGVNKSRFCRGVKFWKVSFSFLDFNLRKKCGTGKLKLLWKTQISVSWETRGEWLGQPSLLGNEVGIPRKENARKGELQLSCGNFAWVSG